MLLFLIVVRIRQPTINTDAPPLMWHYVIRVNHVTVYRIIRLNYFNITKLCAFRFPRSNIFRTPPLTRNVAQDSSEDA